MLLEVCCYGYESAIIAQEHGADRIELCSARGEGGLTPSYGDLQLALQLNIPVYPILRPRGGDFCYTNYEMDAMRADLLMIRELGFRGVVFGILTANGNIDIERMAELIELAGAMEVTCHRAFDMSRDPFASYESLKQLKVARILTSGMKPTAQQGLPLLHQLNAQAVHTVIKSEGFAIKPKGFAGAPIIMAGGGVRLDNIQLFINAGIQELHTSASKAYPSPMLYQNTAVSMGASERDEYMRYSVDGEAVWQMARAIHF